jgi:hypothetical protein
LVVVLVVFFFLISLTPIPYSISWIEIVE